MDTALLFFLILVCDSSEILYGVPTRPGVSTWSLAAPVSCQEMLDLESSLFSYAFQSHLGNGFLPLCRCSKHFS